MGAFLRSETFLTVAVAVVTFGLLVYEMVDTILRRRRERAVDAATRARFRELRRHLWSEGSVCAGAEAGAAILIARAERLAGVATEAEKAARAALAEAAGGRERASRYGIEDRAIDAEAHLQELLRDLGGTLTGADLAALEAGQRAWVEYRDHQVRLCRERRAGADDRWPIRHLVSEAVTLGRVADLEDLRALLRMDRRGDWRS